MTPTLIVLIAVAFVSLETSTLAQGSGPAVVVVSAPVRIYPEVNRPPLATLSVGTQLQLLLEEGQWCRVSFRDRRWGDRLGYLLCEHIRASVPQVKATAEPTRDLIQKAPPVGAVAVCGDGQYVFVWSGADTCAGHGGVASSLPSSPAATPVAPSRSTAQVDSTRKGPRWWETLAAALGAFAQGYAAGSGSTGSAARGTKLMLFGGRGHDMYLGCLSCSEFQSDSLFNEFGRHGNSFQVNSIFNSFGQFGSPFSPYSVCNPYASDPPVIVDEHGRFYGRLTVNNFHRQQVHDAELKAFVVSVCAGR